MNIPAFDDSLRTGLAVIDDQHIWLFELADRVCRKTGECELVDEQPRDSAGDSCGPRVDDAVTEAVYGLVDYATEHFADEEGIMREAGYPLVGVHASLHSELGRQLAGFVVQYVNGDGVPAEQIALFFVAWLTTHIMHHDMEFVGWLAVHPQG
jgi:hemerythrin